MPQELIRLNKFIAQHLNIGRRAADDLISAGKVLVNGAKPPLGYRIQPGDSIIAGGIKISAAEAQTFIYLLFNKPVGYVCSRRKQGAADTIYSILPAKYQHLKPVGRLDKNSSGLLLLTNDGDTAHRFLHPSFVKTKKYEVILNQPLQPQDAKQINDKGVELPDGVSKLRLKKLKNDKNWEITMHEGRNRQIRRTFSALGYEVIGLNRTHFGSLGLEQLGGKQTIEIERPKQD